MHRSHGPQSKREALENETNQRFKSRDESAPDGRPPGRVAWTTAAMSEAAHPTSHGLEGVSRGRATAPRVKATEA